MRFIGSASVLVTVHWTPSGHHAQTSLSSAWDNLRLWMRRGRLPLTALRTFEAAGRLLSFSHAAEELLVSQAAVSRQVRELEAWLGGALFLRLHRRVELTE